MLTETDVLKLLQELESFRVERTVSTKDSAKFCEAICAFANDMPASGLPGYLFIGVDDKGNPSRLRVLDELLKELAGIPTEGNILPAPALSVYRIPLSSGTGDIAVVEVQPSELPPVRYKGQICIRRGPRKGIANEAEERILSERRAIAARSFDARPCTGSTLDDLALDLFTSSYRPYAVAADVIEENHRPIEHQLASLRLFDLARNCPTNAGIILFAKDVLNWIPNAFVQYVRFEGVDQGADIGAERRFTGDLLNLLRELDGFTKNLPEARPVASTALQEHMVYSYPPAALRELLMNSIMHRDYAASSFVRLLHFSDRVEIQNPGPLFGEATSTNFPRQTSYRNPVLAEAMKVLGFVNRFGRGVERAKIALAKNGSPPAEFEFGDTFFGATIRVHP